MLDIEEFEKKIDKKSRLLGIDPGKKRIGIAVCDENKIIATPYTTLIKNSFSELLGEINKIIKDNAKDLAINLSKNIMIPVTMWDERLSSRGAFNLSNNLNVNTSKKISKLDENSAAFILQGAIDYLKREIT